MFDVMSQFLKKKNWNKLASGPKTLKSAKGTVGTEARKWECSS